MPAKLKEKKKTIECATVVSNLNCDFRSQTHYDLFWGCWQNLILMTWLGKLISSLDFHSSSEGKKETVLMLLWSDVFSFPIPFPSPSFFFLNPKWVNIDFRQLMAKEAVPAMDAAHKYSKRHALPVEPPSRPLCQNPPLLQCLCRL